MPNLRSALTPKLLLAVQVKGSAALYSAVKAVIFSQSVHHIAAAPQAYVLRTEQDEEKITLKVVFW
jgi:hypothetical protein